MKPTLRALPTALLAVGPIALFCPSTAPSDGPSLAARVVALQRKTTMLQRFGTELFVVGADLRLRNGAGATSTVNGLGNLVIGYDVGGAGGGSHNLVVGDAHTRTSYGGVLAGRANRVSAPHAVAVGASGPTDARIAEATGAVAVGGVGARADGPGAVAVGGRMPWASGPRSTTFGGNDNHSVGAGAVVVGGQQNEASGDLSVILGGLGGETAAAAPRAVVAGGQAQTANAGDSVILGGGSNETSGAGSVAVGGASNSTHAVDAVAVGGLFVRAEGVSAVALGGTQTIARGGVAVGGLRSIAIGIWSVVTGGTDNTATGSHASNSGGVGRWVSATNGWVAGSLFEND